MKIIKAKIFKQFPEITFGMSTKFKFDNRDKFNFNMSLNIGDELERVESNRKLFFEILGLSIENVAYQNQIHSDIIKETGYGGNVGESDAIITPRKGVGIAISTADCVSIYIYDKTEKVIAGIHSGWRGTEKKILQKTLDRLNSEFDSEPENLFVYIAPSISQNNYEVGKEVAEKFDIKYSIPIGEKYLLNVSKINYDMLIDFGIPKEQIEVSELCSFDESYLHSFRRNKNESGRAFGLIAIKE
ncbi:MAG: peptidoglycan editing factor PgeF [Melioribacteraceae bacterium]|nr:peptidoglycan editing factor PgeF [Melioribacteraceae bacterium]